MGRNEDKAEMRFAVALSVFSSKPIYLLAYRQMESTNYSHAALSRLWRDRWSSVGMISAKEALHSSLGVSTLG